MPHPIWFNFFRRTEPQAQKTARLWGETPLFKDISQRALLQLAKTMHPRQYGTGDTIFKQNDRGAGAALILSGAVEIRYNDTVLAKLEAGDFFGEVALAVDERRTADAVATEPTELVFFLRHELNEWIEQAPREGAQFGLNLALILGNRLRQANQTLASGHEPS